MFDMFLKRVFVRVHNEREDNRVCVERAERGLSVSYSCKVAAGQSRPVPITAHLDKDSGSLSSKWDYSYI